MNSRPHISFEESWKEPAVHYSGMKAKATRRKRRKLDLEDKKTFDDELAKRDIALFYFNFGVLQSGAPSFRRMEPSCVSKPFDSQSYHLKRKTVYPPESYFTVTVKDTHINEGAMGRVYRIIAEIKKESGAELQRNLILKHAIGPKKEQMLQEYKIYKRLAEAGVTHGIISVHGLFHDMETDAMIMVMDDAGMSLRTRAIKQGVTLLGDTYDTVDTSEEECDAFIEVLNGIHSAGVLHRDLRIDNLMINENGEVFIVDFDLAHYDPAWSPNQYCKNSDLTALINTIGWYWKYGSEDEGSDEDGGQ